MISFPNAKINLGLNILNKRPDGFHNIETIFYPLKSLTDVLEFIEIKDSKNVKTHCAVSGHLVESDSADNLCVKAYNILKEEFDLPPVQIHLHKNIPVGAGLGGGSSDAAFMLSALNNYFKLNIEDNKLQGYASKIGSDCAFFISNEPCFAYSRGEKLEPITLSLNGYYILLIYPNAHVSTGEAYAGVKPKTPEASLKNLVLHSVNEWKEFVINDFEKSIFPNYPALAEIKQTLYKMGALYASMSGSGSSIYGIFKSKPQESHFFKEYFTHISIL